MNAAFQCTGLSIAPFRHLIGATDATLARAGARRVTATDDMFPCRVTLDHAKIGETLLLLNHVHLDDLASPYRAMGPIFVRESVTDPFHAPGVVPTPLSVRLLSLRAYDRHNMMIDADVVDGQDAEREIARLFAQDETAFIHAHYARRGCFACRIDRADQTG